MQIETRQLISKSAIYSIGNILVKLIAFLLIPLYARKLLPDEYGIVALLELIEILGKTILGFGLVNGLLRFFIRYKAEKRESELVSSIYIVTLLCNVVLVGALLLFPGPLVTVLLTNTPENTLYLRYILLVIFSGLFQAILINVLMAEEKAKQFIYYTLLHFILLISLNIYKVGILNQGVLGIVESKLYVAAVDFVLIHGYLVYRFRPRFSATLLKESFSYGAPLVFVGISLNILTLASRYLLKVLGDMADVGVYSMAAKFGMLINMVLITPFRQALYPLIFRLSDQREIKNVYRKFLTFFLFVAFVFVLGISLFAREIVTVVTSADYMEGYVIVPFIAFSYLLFGARILFVGVLAAEKKTKIIAYSSIAGALLNIVANIVLIPVWGITGAAFATLLSYFFIVVITFLPQQKIYFINWDWKRAAKASICAAVIYAASLFTYVSDIYLSIGLKLLFFFAYPLLLYLWGFFQKSEIEDMRRIFKKLLSLSPVARP